MAFIESAEPGQPVGLDSHAASRRHPMTAVKLASRMQLKPGCLEEYRRRHDDLWPDLAALLHQVGIRDYSIHHDPADDALFAVMWCDTPERLRELPDHPVMARWWATMAPLMMVNPDLSPRSLPLATVFHLA